MGKLSDKLKYDISVVVTAHAEGHYLHKALKSLNEAVLFAEDKGLRCEIVLVLDKCKDRKTRAVVKNWADFIEFPFQLIVTDFGFPADSRNCGVETSNGRFIALLDGDDLFCRQWLYKAYKVCAEHRTYIAHPEALFYFPLESFIRFYNPDSSAFLNLLYSNQWTSLVMAHRDVFIEVPSVRNTEVWAYQDWLWHCDAVVAGCRHKLVPGTVMAVRQKRLGDSLWQGNYAKNKVVRPNQLFNQMFRLKYALPKENKKRIGFVDGVSERVINVIDNFFYSKKDLYTLSIAVKRFLSTLAYKVFNKGNEKWIEETIQELSSIEPQLKLEPNIQIRRVPKKCSLYKSIDTSMKKLVEDDKVVVYIFDRLSKRNLQMVPSKTNLSKKNPAYIITTNRSKNKKTPQLNSSHTWIDIGNKPLLHDQKITLLHRLLLEADIAYLHITGSKLAYEMLVKFRKSFGPLNLGLSLIKQTNHKSMAGWEILDYPEIFDMAKIIYCCNEKQKRFIIDIFGLGEEIVSVIDQK